MQSKAAFKRALQCGLGRCALALQQPDVREAYREIVLWGCLHSTAYDPQCEGTRADYLYTLVRMYDDDAYFLTPLLARFTQYKQADSWTFLQFCELLTCFAKDGHTAARDALNAKYAAFYDALCKTRHINQALSDNFEALCVARTSLGGIDAFLDISQALLALYARNPRYVPTDFRWFFDNAAHKFGARHIRHALCGKQATPALRALYHTLYDKPVPQPASQPVLPPTADDYLTALAQSGTISPALRVRFRYRADDATRTQLANALLAQTDPAKRAALLTLFRSTPFPLPCAPLLADAQADHPQLRDAAREALTQCRDAAVRDFALTLLAAQPTNSDALCMHLTNYRPADKALLLTALAALPVNKSDSGWHAVVLHICAQFRAGNPARLPREVLCFVYERSLCSCCRASAVHFLGKRGWLTPEMLDECRHDSSEEIRRSRYVAQK